MNLGRYLEVLREPGVARLALFATAGRLPFGILPLSIVLLMREEAYGYGEIGAVLAAEALAVGVTAAFVGRLIDRIGQTRVIRVTGAITVAAIMAETVAILSGASVALIVALGAVQGATVPPISASMRALWARLVPEELVESAYALDAIQLELLFVVGPLVAAGLATAWTPVAALLLCAGLYGFAAIGFTSAPASRAARQVEQVQRTRLGALGSAGMRTLIGATTITAFSFGALEVALPAFAEHEGSRALAGPLITAWSLGSLAGGLWYGARSWRAPAEHRSIVLTALLAMGCAPLAFAESIEVMAALLLLTGLALAPLATTNFSLVDRLAPPGTSTEAYSWQIVATVVGASAGSLLAGLLVEHAEVGWAFGSAALACAGGFVVLFARRRTLVRRPPSSVPPT
jgi:MFS family permease